MPFCENCGAQVSENTEFCENCGEKTGSSGPALSSPTDASPVTQPLQPDKTAIDLKKKNPFLALVLSLLISGVGQMYNGQVKKGLVLLVGLIIFFVAFWPIAIIVWLFGMYDAYTTALKINDGVPAPDIFSN
jgi:TM2 domain-containing membrane protein YozV